MGEDEFGERPELPPSLIELLHQQTYQRCLRLVQCDLAERLKELSNIDWDKHLRLLNSWRKN